MHQVPGVPRPALAAEDGRDVRVLECVVDRAGLAAADDCSADETDAVAVVDVLGSVRGAQWLKGTARRRVPAIDGDPTGDLAQPVARHEVFLAMEVHADEGTCLHPT
jgi:hypothetical protein